MAAVLAELFSSKVRASVLAHLLARPRRAFGLTDLSRALGLPVSSLQHECYKLERIGVLMAARDGNARRYRPDPRFALLAPLTALVLRDLGPGAALPAAFEGADSAGIDAMFLAGEAVDPRRAATLVVVGEVPLDRLEDLEARARAAIAGLGGCEPELGYFRPRDWADRIATGNPLAAVLVAAPCIDLLGPIPPPPTAAVGEPGAAG